MPRHAKQAVPAVLLPPARSSQLTKPIISTRPPRRPGPRRSGLHQRKLVERPGENSQQEAA